MVRRRKIAEALSTVLLILLALACVATSLAPHFGWSVDAVFSGSMEPALKVGGVVVPVEAEDIKVRGIITFYSPLNEQLTSHRVIAVEEGSSFGFQTKGDANEDADSFIVPAENMVGKVYFHIPYFGYVTQFVKTPLGFLLTLAYLDSSLLL